MFKYALHAKTRWSFLLIVFSRQNRTWQSRPYLLG